MIFLAALPVSGAGADPLLGEHWKATFDVKGTKPHKSSPRKYNRPLPVKSNPRLAAQNRKLLGKHYANKYGTRRG